MRILVHGASLGEREFRMRRAAAALALRGHQVFWGPGGAPSEAGGEVREIAPGIPLSRFEADLVLGGARDPLRTAYAGWRTRAHVLLLTLDAGGVARWNAIDHWAWNSLFAAGLVEETEADAMRRAGGSLGLERLALWSAEAPAAEPDATHADTEILERACERALARHRGRSPRGAVFLDRDGTLVVERGYLADPDDLELLPGVPEALRDLAAAGFALIVISNQSGVGRGLFPLARVHQAMARLRTLLRARGIELDAIYFCPHRPDAGCDCRKPGAALLERASDDLGIALSRSFMVGDKLIDARAGHNAGSRGVLVRTGYGRDEERANPGPGMAPPERVFDDLRDASRWMLAEAEAAGLA